MQTRQDLIKIITRIERVLLVGFALFTAVDFNAKLGERDIIETKLYTPAGICYKIIRQQVVLDENKQLKTRPYSVLYDSDGDSKFDEVIGYEYDSIGNPIKAHNEYLPTGDVADTYFEGGIKAKECFYNKAHQELEICLDVDKKEVVTP